MSASLSEFGDSFQEKLFQALLVDRAFAEQAVEVISPTYFDKKYLSFLSEKFFEHAKKYKVFPTLGLLLTIIKDSLRAAQDKTLSEQIVGYLQRIRHNPDPGDLGFVKDKALDWCRKQALKQALEEAVDLMVSEKYESIVEVIKKAVVVGTTPAMGHDFFEDIESRFVAEKRETIPTGLDELDKREVLNGGLGRGELLSVVAASGVGKSHFLVYLGTEALRRGFNVLHYTLELSEIAVGTRYDSNLCDIDSHLLLDHKDQVKEKYKDNKMGKLIIKEFPTNTATVYNLRAHMERLVITKGFVPDIIIIDYADILRSSRQYDSLRHELKLVYEELRALAMEKRVVLATASQSNKEGLNSEVLDLGNLSEGFGKAFVCDTVITLSRRSHEKASGVGRMFLAKNRNGRDGLLWDIKIDTARSKFELTKESSVTDAATENESEAKKLLRKRWQELDKSGVIVSEAPKAAE